jgi:nitrate/nitrite transport system permease protein
MATLALIHSPSAAGEAPAPAPSARSTEHGAPAPDAHAGTPYNTQEKAAVNPSLTAAAAAATPPAARRAWSALGRTVFLKVFPPLFGLALLIGIWHLATAGGGSIPAPARVWGEAMKLFADPFYSNGPNDQGIGWNILSSLKRVAIGFGLAAAVGIPLGFILGRFNFAAGMVNPIISLLRPVSPLAWLPIGLLVFQRADPAATWTIFICSIWPMIMNTAQGVQRIPQDYLNVARVLNLSEWKIFTKILFPSVLPYMLTGIRLSIGTAWLVIVAAEMLTGGVGIGFWVWDEWNNLKVESIIIAIFVIGIVGLLLEQALVLIARRFAYETR